MKSTRRQFVSGATAAIVAGGIAPTYRARAQPATPVRRSIATMTDTDPDLVAYRAAVSAMRALPESDPRNWTRQARIHEGFCPHRNWYFLPWHRAYLAAFERICRQLSGKADFALPYWDWSVQPGIPPAFSSGTTASNPLKHARPGLADGREIRPEFVGPDVVALILESPDFESLGSTRPEGQDSADPKWLRRPGAMDVLEARPHNTVHGTLGGDMRTMMSPLDPIFWLHHCNVDRIWAMWNARGGINSTEAMWLDLPLHGQFVNADASSWNVLVSDVLGLDALGIAFDQIGETVPSAAPAGPPAGPDSAGQRLARYRRLSWRNTGGGGGGRAASAADGIFLASVAAPGRSDIRTPLQVRFKLDRNLSSIAGQIAPPTAASPRSLGRSAAAQKAPRVMAILEDIPAPVDPATSVRVFLNKPDLGVETPITDPHYVTSFSFFDHKGDHGSHDHGRHGGSAPPAGSSVEIDLSTTLARLQKLELLRGGELAVQLVAIAPEFAKPEDSLVIPARVDLIVL